MSTRFEPNRRGECPHCSTFVRFESARNAYDDSVAQQEHVIQGIWDSPNRPKGSEITLAIYLCACPNCGLPVIGLGSGRMVGDDYEPASYDERSYRVAWPAASWEAARGVPEEVPKEIAQDFREASAVLAISPKASAALSRRCLQAILREAGHTQYNLEKQIEAALPNLPHYIARDLDHLRVIGNLAAHATKSKSSGEILDVEPGEAEWSLEVLEELFDHYYVGPAQSKQKREALNRKLNEAGKAPAKEPLPAKAALVPVAVGFDLAMDDVPF